jgi:hypothetical protein
MTTTAKALALCIASVTLLVATPVLADPTTPDTAQAEPAKPSSQVDSVSTGSINLEPKFEQRMADCMAIWDKGTHMTKDQWRRTCKTTLSGP